MMTSIWCCERWCSKDDDDPDCANKDNDSGIVNSEDYCTKAMVILDN